MSTDTEKTSIPPNEKIRKYRLQLVTAGQASPPRLGKAVADLIQEKLKDKTLSKPLRIVDVGCGLGHNMKLIDELLPNTFITIHGIDWSPATVNLHKNNPSSIYDEIRLCDSSMLPYPDNEFDIALSMENLEHLYSDGCIRSLEEMKRISKHLVVTTPLPSDVINFRWIYPELEAATKDETPLTDYDFVCLESAVHKSTIYPKSMLQAGFSIKYATHGIYFGKSEELEIEQISYVAIDSADDKVFRTNKEKYIWLLTKSAELHAKITSHHLYTIPPTSARTLIRALKHAIRNLIP